MENLIYLSYSDFFNTIASKGLRFQYELKNGIYYIFALDGLIKYQAEVLTAAFFAVTEVIGKDSQIELVNETDFVNNKIPLANKVYEQKVEDAQGVSRLAVDAMMSMSNGSPLPAGSCYSPFRVPGFKMKTNADVSFSNSSFTSIYSRSGAGVIHKVHFGCDTSNFYIRMLIDGVNFTGDISTSLLEDALYKSESEHDNNLSVNTFIYVHGSSKENITLNFSPNGLLYDTSFEILIKRNSSNSSNKTMESLVLYEVEL